MSSIHPRNWPETPSSKRVKSNTHKMANPNKRIKLIEAIKEHLNRHPNDRQSSGHLAWLMVLA